jgi:O-antigen/teichoic acid export membrane protein
VSAAVAGLIVAWRFVPWGGKGRERKLGNWETGKLGCEARETGPNFLISQFPNFLKAHASRITLLSGWDRALAGALLKEAVPFVILGALGVVHFRTDVVLLRTWCGAAEAGYYGVGYRLTEMLIAADAALLTAVFPAFAHKAETAPDSFVFGFQRLMKYCLLVALPLAVGVTLLAEPLIVLLSDASYLPGAVALRRTIWVVALSFLNGVMYNALYAVRRQVCVLGLFAVATVVNLGLNALLVPGHGLFGAGLTKVASELVCFGLALFFAARHVARVPLLENLPKPLLATGVMGLAVAACTRVSWLLAVPVGAAVYVAVLFALRPFDDSDRAVWRDIVKRKA